jgi:hypothetical protein
MRRVAITAVLITSLSCIASAGAQARNAAAPRIVNLPYNIADSSGNRWMIYQQGMLRQQGNALYSQGALLTINGSGIAASGNQARIDEKSGELLIDNLQTGTIQISRRIFVNAQHAYVRYIDVFRSTQPQDVTVTVQTNSNFNYSMQGTQQIEDPRNKQRPIGHVAMLEAGRAVFELYAAPGSKLGVQLSAQPNNNIMQASYQVTIPAGKQVAILHLHGVSTSLEAATQLVGALRTQELLADVPADIRKMLLNVTPQKSIGDRELLRGDLFDVVELRGGDQMKGTLAEQSYKLQTSYGVLELPADRVIGLINVGQFRPRQLIVTVDGEVFGGSMEKQSIGLNLSSGQTTQIPLAQVSRAGYRKRSSEPEEWTFDKPMVSLRSGERMLVEAPAGAIEVMTRYGLLKLEPSMIARIDFQSEDHGVHEIYLSDGSSFSGLVTAPQFVFQLVGTSARQQVTFPMSLLSRIQFSRAAEDGPADGAPVMRLSDDDELVGMFSGSILLDTGFDAIEIKGAELRSLTHLPDATFDVQATLWDQTTVSGVLRDPLVQFDLKCGLSMKVPLALVAEYQNPQPQPSASMVDRVKSVVGELSAEDWKQRERAEAQLLQMGPVIQGVLKELSGSVPPEAQHRIDAVLAQFEKKSQAPGQAIPDPG